MKVLYRHILLAMSLTAILQGCTDIYDETGNPDMEIALGSRLTSSSVSSKTAISTDYTGDPLVISYVRWDEGGNVFPAGTAVRNASMSGIPDARNGWVRDISCKSPEYYRDRTSEVGFVGIYPAQESWSGGISGGSLSGRTLSYTIDGETDVMVSGFAKGNYSTKVAPLTFRHALCQFRIYAYAVNADIREEWGELTGVTFRNLPDAVDVMLPASVDEEPSFSYSGGLDQNGLTRTFDGGLVMPVEVPVPGTDAPCAVLLAGVPYGTSGDADNSLLGISVQTSKSSGENSVSIARNFRAGYTYNIFLRFSSVGIIDADVSVGEWEYGGEYEVEETFTLYSDLSRYGNANCYIVSSGNMGYSFDATVKGNGVNTLTSRTGETIQLPDLSTALSPAPADVRILKSDALMKLNVSTGNFEPVPVEDRTETPVIDKSSLTLSGGRVLFKVPGMDDKSDYRLTVKGNVLLGVYASETDDTPLWTWHIWVTDPPQNQGYLNGYVALDRNLGAVSSDPADFSAGESFCTGLYYQWGRKDPMMIRDGKLMNEVSGTPVQVAEAHRTPTVYYYDASGGNDWTTEDDGVKDHLWGYISAWDDIGKTMYDPCPPGYRVSGNPIWQDQSEAVGAEELSDRKGYYFTIGGTTRIYYPASKSIVGGKVRDSDSSVEEPSGSRYAYVYQLSATPYEEEMHDVSPEGSDALAYHFRYNIGVAGSMTNPNADYNAMVPDFTNTDEKYSTQRSSAYPVRCVFEDSAPVVNDLSASQTANCYVVQKTGFYSFRADVCGNGTTSVTVFTDSGGTEVFDIDGGVGASVGDLDHVDVLWWQGDISEGSGFSTFAKGDPSSGEIAEACPIIMMDGGKPDIGGNVMFYARIDGEDDYGNIGLAAYNAVGDILWTWHIWIQPSIKVQTVGSYSMIDRNLGATYAPENESGDLTNGNVGATYGFYYQWGRKDPFFGNGTVWFEKENGQWTRRSGIKGTSGASTIDSSREYPLTFYTSSEGNRPWQTTMDTNGGNGPVNHLWGYTGSTEAGLAFVKTMWDPCPPGYRVMQYDVFMTARICYTEENNENRNGFRMDDYKNTEAYYPYGLMISPGDKSGGENVIEGEWWNSEIVYSPGEMVIDGNIWLPNTGYADSSDGGFYDMGNDGYLSTSTPMGGRTCREIRWEKDAISEYNWSLSGGHWDYFYGVSQRNSSAYTANGRPVRCQME